jgi:hypothetical protein
MSNTLSNRKPLRILLAAAVVVAVSTSVPAAAQRRPDRRPTTTTTAPPTEYVLGRPRLEKIATFHVQIGAPVEMGVTGKGRRRIIPITGGTATGLFTGTIMPGGSDVQVIRPDNVAEIVASYGIETDRGTHVFIQNPGLRHAPPAVFDRLMRGEIVDPNLVYFRTTPRIETDDPALKWMENDIFVASGARYPDRVQIDLYHLT